MLDTLERLRGSEARFYAACRGESPDRTPIMVANGLALAKYADPAVVAADCVERPYWVADKAMDALHQIEHIDAVGLLCQLPNPAMGSFWLAKVRRPGIELGRDEMWQIDEVALMTTEDYDYIIDNGWDEFFTSYMKRIGCTDEDFEESGKAIDYGNRLLANLGVHLREVLAIGCWPITAISAARSCFSTLLMTPSALAAACLTFTVT